MRRLIAVAALLCAAVAGGGCSSKEDIVTSAQVEGLYLDVGPLDYQVQISRQLNPAQVPDDSYLTGIHQGVLPPEADETYFGVFLRVQNQTEKPEMSASEFEIVDTQDRHFKPLEMDADSNPFAYQAKTIAPKQVYPAADSAGSMSSAQGAMLLFKLPIESYSNRPLVFRIIGPSGATPAEAEVDLDV